MATLIIRDLDPVVVASIDRIWKKNGHKSREAFLRSYLTNLAVVGELKEMDSKYSVLLEKCMEVISYNTEVMHQVIENFD